VDGDTRIGSTEAGAWGVQIFERCILRFESGRLSTVAFRNITCTHALESSFLLYTLPLSRFNKRLIIERMRKEIVLGLFCLRNCADQLK
jgi:hypothetical protein